jgi:hypothetical protein
VSKSRGKDQSGEGDLSLLFLAEKDGIVVIFALESIVCRVDGMLHLPATSLDSLLFCSFF